MTIFDLLWGKFLKIFLNCFESQVSGCYDSGAELYRWAEMTDRDWELNPKAYADVFMEGALCILRVVCLIVILFNFNGIFLP